MGRIDDATLDNVCLLAKLSLEEGEREALREEMEKMVAFVEKLGEMDTSQVEPLVQVGETGNVFREDVVKELDNEEVQALLANAPRSKEGQFLVPKTL